MLFHVYVLFLIASGVMMLVMALTRAPYARRGQVWNFIFGAGFTIYGLYLLLFLRGGHYFIFFYAFILPVLMAVRFFADRSKFRAGTGNGAPRHSPGTEAGQAPCGYQGPAPFFPPQGGQPAGQPFAQSGGQPFGQPGQLGQPAPFGQAAGAGQGAGYGQAPGGYGQVPAAGQPGGYGQPAAYGQQQQAGQAPLNGQPVNNSQPPK
jgi:hypothetical protein